MSKPKLFLDTMSPLCRAVMMFMAANNIPYEAIQVSLEKRQ